MEHSARKFRFPRVYSRTRLHILIAYFMGKSISNSCPEAEYALQCLTEQTGMILRMPRKEI
jgi:hypothetical protein